MGTHWSEARLKKSLASGISCVSVKSDNLQGCAANVKETPPSPKHKLAKESMKSLCSVGPLKTDDSKDGVISVNDSSLTRRPNFSSSEEEHTVAHDEDLVESSDSLLAKESMRSLCSVVHLETDDSKDGVISVNDSSLTRMTKGSSESFDSGVSFKIDLSKDRLITFQERIPPRDEMIQELSSEVGWKHR